MKKLIYFLFFISLSGIGQNKIDFKIHSINRIENEYKTDYIYEITCSIKNIHSEELSFFLNKERILNNAESSLSNTISYNFYQNENLINPPVFNRRKQLNLIEEQKEQLRMKKSVDSMMKNIKNVNDFKEYIHSERRNHLLSQITTLKPNEIITLKHELIWNKIRTIFDDSIEIYLDENAKYYLQFSLYLHKTPFEKFFTEKEKKEIINNPNFIETYFTSEKFKIDLN